MATILELFHSSGLKESVKADKETLVEQETSGIRVKTAVELNNPLIYGNEATRIVNKSTPVLEDMKSGTGGTEGDGGLIGKGIGKLTGGKLNSIGDVRDKVNDKLGIPSNQIPSRILGQIKGQTSDVPVTLGESGTEFGKFLKSTGGGNPSTLLKQGIGKGIGLAKDKLRGALFGKPPGIGENEIEPQVNITNNEVTYSIYKNSPEGGDKYSENPDLTKTKLQIPSVPSVADLKDKGTTILKSGMGKLKGKASLSNLGGPEAKTDAVEPDVMEFSPEVPYSDYKKDPERGDIYNFDDTKSTLEGTKLDLSRVSPIYGLKRKSNDYFFGKRPGEKQKETYGFRPRDTSELSRFSPVKPYQGDKKSVMERSYRLGTSDGINKITPSDDYTMENDAFIKVGEDVYKDFIPLWVKKHGSEKPIVFRAIMSGLSETTSPDWSSNKFIGNPYSFYMFGGVERSISFNIKLFASSPLELVGIWERLKTLTSYAYPTIDGGLTTPPIIQFRIGSIYSGKTGFIESLQYTIPDESNWETNGELGYLPKMVDAAIGIKFIESAGSEERLYDMDISKVAAKAINDSRQEKADMESERTGQPAPVVPKETPKKPVNVTVNGEATSAAAGAKNKVKSLIGGAKGKAQEAASTIPKPGEINPIKSQSATADTFDGESPTVAAKALEYKKKISADIAAFIVERKASAPSSTVEVVSKTSLPAWAVRLIPYGWKYFNYHIIKQSAYSEKDGKDITEYHIMLNSNSYRINFANSYEDDPASEKSEAEEELAKKNAQQSSVMDKFLKERRYKKEKAAGERRFGSTPKL